MADFTQTVTNNMVVLGASQGNLWGTFLWNTNWGVSDDLWTASEKTIGNTLGLASAVGKDFVREPINNTLNLTEDLASLLKELGIWDYVFTKPTSNGINQVTDQFSKVSNQSSTWSGVSDGSTTWSDA